MERMIKNVHAKFQLNRSSIEGVIANNQEYAILLSDTVAQI